MLLTTRFFYNRVIFVKMRLVSLDPFLDVEHSRRPKEATQFATALTVGCKYSNQLADGLQESLAGERILIQLLKSCF